jgi:hypothetical protein
LHNSLCLIALSVTLICSLGCCAGLRAWVLCWFACLGGILVCVMLALDVT